MFILLLFFPSTNISTRLDQLLRSLHQQNINNCVNRTKITNAIANFFDCNVFVIKKQGLFVQFSSYTRQPSQAIAFVCQALSTDPFSFPHIRGLVRAHVFSRPVLPPGGVWMNHNAASSAWKEPGRLCTVFVRLQEENSWMNTDRVVVNKTWSVA